ncbi:hypothetical protein BI040_gp04 [Escherichia phage vB_EcoS_NBD2]|uniref:Uncharacterized protein n=1 Tax=Escherichia phage vB_EcoS_NBD2 TaxID=1852563 RepID=A0A192YAF7_9CAUD|nr:hypothetical protein BI040_gp04 [Escherichia phage vB_EcoS_NBD2]ANM45846.1 hypothetical protein NBD2_04 [Escherichia phage vB_EcoS_NBD2]
MSVTITHTMKMRVESMPLEARIIGVYQGDDLVDFVFKPNRIEVHDDIITFLDAHGAHRGEGFTAEVSFKRGTILKVEVK